MSDGIDTAMLAQARVELKLPEGAAFNSRQIVRLSRAAKARIVGAAETTLSDAHLDACESVGDLITAVRAKRAS